MNKKMQRAIAFFLNSGLTGALYAAILFVSDSLLHVKYYVSITIAYAIAMTCYFIVNKKAIFKTDSPSRSTSREVTGFSILLVINYLISLAVVAIMKHFTNEIYSGSLLAGVLTITLTYFVFDKIIFKKHS